MKKLITEEEKQEIINAAVEKALLMLPETMGNLMAQHASFLELNRKFFSEHPEFKAYPNIVKESVVITEGEDPLENYEKILKNAVPEIERRIKTLDTLDMKTIDKKPDRRFERLDAPSDDKRHGEI